MSTAPDRPIRVLVAFATRHGSTAEIAEAIADELRRHGLDTDLRRAGDVRDLSGYDAVLLGSAVYMKRWERDARRLLAKQSKALAQLPFWIFSSGPFGEEPDTAWSEPPRIVRDAQRLGVRDHVVFGGRLPLDPSGFVERAIARDTPAGFADCRNWGDIRRWAAAVASALDGGASARPSGDELLVGSDR